MKRPSPTTKKVIGIALMIFGFVALVTPLLPGAIFIFIGAELIGLKLLSPERLRRFWNMIRGRKPEKPDEDKSKNP